MVYRAQSAARSEQVPRRGWRPDSTSMQLYLSSYRWGDDASQLGALAAGGVAVVIANALDYTDDVARKDAATTRELGELTALGFSARELDLRSHFGRPAALREQLADVALIWVMGGNAFLLRRAMKYSGLDDYLSERRGDALVYGGYSAGAIVVTPTLRGIERVDSPDVLAEGYDPAVVWDGVGLVPYSLAPHYESAHPESERMDAVVDYFVTHQMAFRTLRDGEVIVCAASMR